MPAPAPHQRPCGRRRLRLAEPFCSTPPASDRPSRLCAQGRSPQEEGRGRVLTARIPAPAQAPHRPVQAPQPRNSPLMLEAAAPIAPAMTPQHSLPSLRPWQHHRPQALWWPCQPPGWSSSRPALSVTHSSTEGVSRLKWRGQRQSGSCCPLGGPPAPRPCRMTLGGRHWCTAEPLMQVWRWQHCSGWGGRFGAPMKQQEWFWGEEGPWTRRNSRPRLRERQREPS